jgi:nucleoside-diphosphate-sugar epimerase
MAMLVTGATGFVGAHLVNELLSSGNKIRAFIRNASKEEELRQRGVETVLGDLRDPAAVRTAVNGVDVIFHCAAASSLCGAGEIRETNQEGLRNLLDAARQASCGRIILLSSANVYGIRNLSRATEETPLRRAKEPHADIKIDGELLAQEFADEHGLDITILRPGLIYGAGERHLPRLAEAIRRGKFVFIGSRNNIVPLVYVSDMVQAMLRAAETEQVSRVYNITDGSRTTIGELVNQLAKLMSCPAPTRVLPYFLPWFVCTLFERLGRKGPINRTALRFLGTSRYIDIERARGELGFEPKVNLSDGLAATVDWIGQESAAKTPA